MRKCVRPTPGLCEKVFSTDGLLCLLILLTLDIERLAVNGLAPLAVDEVRLLEKSFVAHFGVHDASTIQKRDVAESEK